MGTIELDLHGYTCSEAIQEFIRVYNDAVETTQRIGIVTNRRRTRIRIVR